MSRRGQKFYCFGHRTQETGSHPVPCSACCGWRRLSKEELATVETVAEEMAKAGDARVS